MKKFYSFLFLLFITLSVLSQEDKDKKEKFYVDIWGNIQTDLIFDIKQMDPDWIGGFRPSKIPVYHSDPGWGTDGHTYFSVRPSTFRFEGVLPTNHKWGEMRFRFEFDLFGMGVHAGETTLRFRLAHVDWGPWRVGKDWSTFVDLSAMPANYEWWGPSGMVLLPNTVFRYTHIFTEKSKLELALEGGGTVIDTDQLREVDPELFNVKAKDVLPDFIGRYTYQGDFGYVKIAGLLRNLEYELISIDHERAENRNKFGWAVNLTSNINVFNKKGVFLLQGVFGEGYAGYNNDGGVELAPGADYRIESPFQYGFSAFYDHHLTDRFLVSVGYSETNQDNSEGQLGTAFHKSKYSVTQFTYTVLKDMFNVGINYQYGKRYNKDGASADDQRILFTAVYFFNFKH